MNGESKYDKFRYEKVKLMHKCVRCGKVDDYTLSGKVRCKNCTNLDNIKIKTIEAKEKRSEYFKKRYYSRKAQGICVKCGKKPAVNGHVTCEDCV